MDENQSTNSNYTKDHKETQKSNKARNYASHLHHLGVDFALTDFVTSLEDSSVI
jgi:hypothetical protein